MHIWLIMYWLELLCFYVIVYWCGQHTSPFLDSTSMAEQGMDLPKPIVFLK